MDYLIKVKVFGGILWSLPNTLVNTTFIAKKLNTLKKIFF